MIDAKTLETLRRRATEFDPWDHNSCLGEGDAKAVLALLAEREELLSVLRALEKRSIVLTPCPICDCREDDREHASSCRLAALLKE